ncbi:hypothetical protein E2C01_094199 [Portunus trituberculatus]|uniref:Uncharacterized protein n=1 Tax=Portunus trituberculatus TaxID=210409 RepID=A0A5B7JWY8_PORTR|nr:hypothetical protein [Portunus trituberculatus]
MRTSIEGVKPLYRDFCSLSVCIYLNSPEVCRSFATFLTSTEALAEDARVFKGIFMILVLDWQDF